MDKYFSTEKIAILLACRNGETFIAEQMKSLLLQSEEDWELFIHDDGSTDRTLQICEQFAADYPEKIHVIEGPPSGSGKNNFLYLLKTVRAPYYMFCDQDDHWKDYKVSRTLQKMKEAEGDNKPVLIFSDLEVVDKALQTIEPSMNQSQGLNPERTSFHELMIQNCITGCTVMINDALAEYMRMPCNTEKVIMHDWWAGLIAAYFGKIEYLQKTTILYRQHEKNTFGAYKPGSISYLKAKLFHKDEIHDSLKATQDQVAEFLKTFAIQDEILKTYSQLYQLPKNKRLAFYRKHNIRMQGLLRNIGLFIFG